MKPLARYWLTKIGARLSSKTVYNIGATVNYLAVGQWMHANGYEGAPRFASREMLFDIVGAQVGHEEVLYIEFGVFRGDVTRYWSKLLHNPKSKLHGFDSFEGLPQDWLPQRPKGHFSTEGRVPVIDDVRVQFFKGWFEETIPNYECPAHEILVLNFDADLYSPTSFVLGAMQHAIVPGTYVYFDEFNHQDHELRAFDEFVKKTGMSFSLLGATRAFQGVLFRRTG